MNQFKLSFHCSNLQHTKPIPFVLSLLDDSIHFSRIHQLAAQDSVFDKCIPEYHIPIELNTIISFYSNKPENKQKDSLNCFTIKVQFINNSMTHQNSNEGIETVDNDSPLVFQGQEKHVKMLRNALRGRVMFQNLDYFYNLEDVLGKGKDGIVLQYQQISNRKLYAGKQINKNGLNHKKLIFQEVSILNQLKHQNIIQIYEVYQEEDYYCIMFDHFQSVTLQTYFLTHQTEKTIKHILQQILEAVHYIHENHIMHRDLKPDNILIDQNQNVKIIDFGFATNFTDSEFLLKKCGTPGYIAPEIANLNDINQRYSESCDIFSLGSIFYKMLTCKDLFKGNSVNEVYEQNKQCKFDILEIKSSLEAKCLLYEMLKLNPNNRITAQECLNHYYFNENSPVQVRQNERKISNYSYDSEEEMYVLQLDDYQYDYHKIN